MLESFVLFFRVCVRVCVYVRVCAYLYCIARAQSLLLRLLNHNYITVVGNNTFIGSSITYLFVEQCLIVDIFMMKCDAVVYRACV